MKNLFILENNSIREAYKQMNKIKRKSLIVAKKNKIILGILSDGDIRRSILKNISLDTSIKSIYNKNYFSINYKNLKLTNFKKIFLKKHYDFIPIVNNENKVQNIIFWEDLLSSNLNLRKSRIKKNNINLVIMAGGKGRRMGDISKIIPKPLLPFDSNNTLLEKSISNFNNFGISKVFLILNYKKNLIKSYFDEVKNQSKINYIYEKNYLGTAGGLVLLKNKVADPFFLINCDTIIDNEDYNQIYSHHIKQNNDLTIVASSKEFIYPYGICKLDNDGNFKKIEEKPKMDFLVNTGCYIINPKLLKLIPKNKSLNMDNFIKLVHREKYKISLYPVHQNSWIDLGNIDNILNNYSK
tara:strand:- start:2925 stop:3986 length:1062 start_codon:yes stop_codon:yes gene_type:complete